MYTTPDLNKTESFIPPMEAFYQIQVNFSYCLSVVRVFVNFSVSSSPEPQGQFHPDLEQNIPRYYR